MKKLFRCQGQPLSLIILAGGKSKRMKQHKALLPAAEGTLIEHILGQLEEYFDEILISVSDDKTFHFLKHKLNKDKKAGQGPMMGIKTALLTSKNEKCFVIACDIPEIDLDFLKELIALAQDYDIVVPVSAKGEYEPLFAIYSRSVYAEMEKLLNADICSLIPLLDRCKTKRIEMKNPSWFRNINTWEDYEDFIKEQKN